MYDFSIFFFRTNKPATPKGVYFKIFLFVGYLSVDQFTLFIYTKFEYSLQ